MLRLGRSIRRNRCIQSYSRTYSSNPPKGPNFPPSNQKKVAAPNTGGGGSFAGVFAVQIATLLTSLVAVSYYAETNPTFDEKVASIPYLPQVLEPFREAIKSTGLLKDAPSSSTQIDTLDPRDAGLSKDVIPVDEKQLAKVDAQVAQVLGDGAGAGSGDSAHADAKEAPKVEALDQGTVFDHTAESAPVSTGTTTDGSAAEQNADSGAAETSTAPNATNEKEEEHNGEHQADSSAPPATASRASITPDSVSIPVLPSEETAQAVDSKVLKQALADSAREYIALRRELESTLLKDVHSLGEAELRQRVKQLATEMFERLAWEDMRLQQSLRGVETELGAKYTDCMVKQRAELEFEIKKILFNFEQEYAAREAGQRDELQQRFEEQLHGALRAQAEGFQATLQKELNAHGEKIQTKLQDQLNHEVATLRQSQVEQLLQLEPQIQGAVAEMEQISKALDVTADAVRETINSHALSAAVLALELALSNSGSHILDAIDENNTSATGSSSSGGGGDIKQRFDAVRRSCGDDPLLSALLESLPASVQQQGALSLPDLQVRFNVMRQEVRKTALAPEAAPKMVGQLIGTALAAVSWAPSGLVPGPGAEESLARAAHYLERGRLQQAVKELDGVPGYAQVLMTDWKKLAHDRLVVDQTVRILKAHSVLRHQAFLTLPKV